MGHRTCKNNKKGRLCSRTHTAGKKAFSVQMPKTIVFLPFDPCESNFADLLGEGARPTERNWEGQNYRGLCCWYLSPVTITPIFLTCPMSMLKMTIPIISKVGAPQGQATCLRGWTAGRTIRDRSHFISPSNIIFAPLYLVLNTVFIPRCESRCETYKR